VLAIPGVTAELAFDATPHALPLAVPRAGIMLHYDDSSEDGWAIAWFRDPTCENGYTWLVTDSGELVQLEDPGLRTPHAGKCRTPNANSHFYGIAATTNGKIVATPKQLARIVQVCASIFRFHGWPAAEIPARIRGHDEEATPPGRKVDPHGIRKDGVPIIDMQRVHALVALELLRP
jgi:N-acetyl-anhydromuramyl-L-alanine amidase AmpD